MTSKAKSTNSNALLPVSFAPHSFMNADAFARAGLPIRFIVSTKATNIEVKEVIEHLEGYLSRGYKWVIHLREKDVLVPDFTEKLTALIGQCGSLAVPCIVSLPVNSDTQWTNVDGIRAANTLLQYVMRFNFDPRLHLADGVFPLQFVIEVWRWMQQQIFYGTFEDAYEFFLWAAAFSRAGYVFGTVKPFVIDRKYPEGLSQEQRNDLRTLFTQNWLGVPYLEI